MTIISFNKSLVHPAYEGIISEMYAPMADNFYQEIKNKNITLLERYEKILTPRNLFDNLFGFDDDRRIKLAAVKKVLYENKIKLP